MQTQEKTKSLNEVLKLVSPGTTLRTAIDDILRSEKGALIVVDSPALREICEGGFRVNCILTSQRIVELSKMDGAIILSSDLKRILYANVLLVPNVSIPSNETGTRHKAAERTARHAKTLAISISERRKKISLYYHKLRYILQDKNELLTRATENLQILEKQREIFDDLLSKLNFLEISDLVIFGDVVSVIQRGELIVRTAKIIERYLIELGKEGIIIRMRLRELTKGVENFLSLIFKDYETNKKQIDSLSSFNFEELLDLENLSLELFKMPSEKKIQPRGYRILTKTTLAKKEIDKLIDNFKNLDNILELDEEPLKEFLGEKAKSFKKELASLKDQIALSKKI